MSFHAQVTDLLAALLEALDLPHPATVGDADAYHELLNLRAIHAKVTLEGVLRDGVTAPAPLDLPWRTAYLRERVAAMPPDTYTHGPPVYGRFACAGCGQEDMVQRRKCAGCGSTDVQPVDPTGGGR